jgi:acyl-coenzyme A synthetase/AMP-(fatty) acid ligase
MGHSHFFIQHSADTSRYGRCIGKPHAFAETAVLGPDGQELPPGEVGELGTKSPTLSLGYWNDSARTYRTRVRGYFLTGDLVYRDDEGYYYHLDRKVDSVDLGGGARLYTAASEERILADCPDVLDCTVVAVRDGDRVVTDVLLQLEAGADPGADRTARVRAALSPEVAATLRQVLLMDGDNIPITPTGKVRKFVLRQRHLEVSAP